MKVTKTTTLAEFLFYADLLNINEESINELFSKLKKYPLPDLFSFSFNDLLFEQLIKLQSEIVTFDDLIFVSFKVVHDLDKKDVLTLSAFDTLKFALFVKDELERITKLFKEIEYKPTAEEQKAGIGQLSHGFFGTIDWYAKRMGIQDHDIVTSFPWVRIYKCLKIDFDNNKYENNYRKVISQKK